MAPIALRPLHCPIRRTVGTLGGGSFNQRVSSTILASVTGFPISSEARMLSGSGPIFLDDRFHSQFAVSLSRSRDEPAENFFGLVCNFAANCNWKVRVCNRLGLTSDLRRQKSN